MKRIQLVSEDKVKAFSIIEENVESKVISNTIIEVQDIELKSIMGTAHYNQVLDEVLSGSTVSGYTIPQATVTLLDEFIEPFLIYGTLFHITSNIHYKVTNKGVVKKTDGNATSANSDELAGIKKRYADVFDTYKQRLIDHLKTDGDPETEPTVSTANTSGWFLEDDYSDYGYQYRKPGYVRRY